MATLPIRTLGLRHLALRVRDVAVSRRFYCDIFGMSPVWEPDAQTSYLSSGSDNLALHQLPPAEPSARSESPTTADPIQPLDHLGFLLATPDLVYEAAELVRARGERILREPREHRDGAHSFYLADPDGNVVQVLFEPNVAANDLP